MNKIIRDSIAHVVREALESLKASGQMTFEKIPEIRVESTKDSKFGDVMSNIALVLASQAGKSAPQIGQLLIGVLEHSLDSQHVFKDVKVGGPGFINFYLGKGPLIAILDEILRQDQNYGRSQYGQGKKILIEFVSVNPTGPLTLAHGRQAAVGDSLCRMMNFSGYRVHKEYYLNDRGRQIGVLGESVYLRYLEILGQKIQFPEDFYQGNYIRDLAQGVIERDRDRFVKEDKSSAIEFFSSDAAHRIMEEIKKDLKDFGVEFDQYFSEREFVQTGKVEACLKQLKEEGHVYIQEGATWFRSTTFGDDKDRVLIKSSGEMTYISPDAAYHQNKFERGYDEIVNIWGPDHHGYIPRLKATVSALGNDANRVKVIILQLATLYEGGEKLSMSTRRGEYVTLRQIIDEVGKDVGRYFFLMRKTDSHLDFDLELAKKQSLENPVYYIQYAHARICSIFEKYVQEGGSIEDIQSKGLLSLESFESGEIELIKILSVFQEVIEDCSRNLDPYGLTDYLLKTAQAFHYFYTQHRVLTEDLERSRSRLALVKGVQIVLRNGLHLLGVSAPASM